MTMREQFIDRIRTLSRPLSARETGEEAVLSDLRGVKAVLFDVYGTCFISGSGDIGVSAATPKVDALVDSLREQGVEMPPELAGEAMERFYELIRFDHQRTRDRGIAFPEVRILDIWEQWRREAMVQVDVRQLAIDVECRLNPVWPMPGLRSTLEALRDAGFLLGIVSNAQVFTPFLFPALIERDLETLGFPASRCIWSWVDQEAKPSRRLYEKVLHALPGLRPEECLYVGNDMRNDIAPSAAEGMKTALFAGDARSLRWRKGDPLVADTRPDLVLTRLQQIPECV
jgi:putative hydrolase of the HAD superfamily